MHGSETHLPDTHELETPKLVGNKAKPRSFSDSKNCNEILSCTGVDGAAFDIENSFTTTDHDHHLGFLMKARTKISLSDDDWRRSAEISLKLVERRLIGQNHNTAFPLVPFVQSFSLNIALYILFGRNPIELEDEYISSLACGINKLWLTSRQLEPDPEEYQFLQKSVKDDLVKIFLDECLEKKETPMNLILPAYETLWRVVLSLYLEVTFRNLDASADWRRSLSRKEWH